MHMQHSTTWYKSNEANNASTMSIHYPYESHIISIYGIYHLIYNAFVLYASISLLSFIIAKTIQNCFCIICVGRNKHCHPFLNL